MSDTDKHRIRARRQQLMQNVAALRYTSGCYIPDPAIEIIDEAGFLEVVNQWLRDFNEVLNEVSDTTTQMAEELYALRNQRTAVRNFLGMDK